MPKNSGDWPTTNDMIKKNQRLLVFTSKSAKEASEGIAYQWRYMVENQHGDGEMIDGSSPNRAESHPMNTTTRSLVLVNHFLSRPDIAQACKHNSAPLMSLLNMCYGAAGKQWSNFVVVDFYKLLSREFVIPYSKLLKDHKKSVWQSGAHSYIVVGHHCAKQV
ncbi:PI-PLC X domain-containing protein At5g67130-like [Tripterygium wilfordii]|uniref:PI-PLC X domain-containing protein At5g67130-like n=1 Tax=Tripterygium wilfordii TaxID=458696 RepID=UPI0018F81F16|nr:PI-PLC X domain-containing protein At5g67130-like [Tripterygium wilfordii]